MADKERVIRISPEKLKSEFLRVLLKSGFTEPQAEKCAGIFTMNSIDGVNSHGINRFPRFIKTVLEGNVRTMAVPELIQRSGSIEQWDGKLGPGPLNASFATERVLELALENGIGMLALSNTNHWMRGGTYGWQAAKRGFVFICWTNTCQNMPAWGASDARIGNNPLVISVPYRNEAIVLDFAMSQYSYGKLDTYHRAGRKLPYPGGFTKEGIMTTDPGAILESWRVLPAGYWKGAGLSLLLDIIAAILSGGLATHQIKNCDSEYGLSQVFIAINIKALHNFPAIENTVSAIIDDLHQSTPVDPASGVRYPGENVLRVREDSLKNGILVDVAAWKKLQSL